MFESTPNDNKLVTSLTKLIDALTALANAALKKIEEEAERGKK